jgi:Uncharacterized alpha/beta hydrolase domain (DUF2235)
MERMPCHDTRPPSLPGYDFLKRLATLHFTQPKHKFYDTVLNPHVGYAKHAISIDENRADFKRVGWSPTQEKQDKRDDHGNLYFEQVWFPGVHADIGGSYLENEARLSDVALGWMVAGASIIPNGLKHDGNVLRISPIQGAHSTMSKRAAFSRRPYGSFRRTRRRACRQLPCINLFTTASTLDRCSSTTV